MSISTVTKMKISAARRGALEAGVSIGGGERQGEGAHDSRSERRPLED
jgi:hypothetical protein